jgi:hypothetical protein
LAYALKKLGNAVNAAEFMRCLNALCEEGDERYRQVVANILNSVRQITLLEVAESIDELLCDKFWVGVYE